MKKVFFLSLVLMSCWGNANAQDKRPKIKDFVNQEIKIDDGWTGQSITMIKEKNEYFILRKFYGSGVPIVATAKYAVTFNSPYQIVFSEIVEPKNDSFGITKGESFKMSVEEEGVCLYLNNLKLVIKK